MMALGGTFNKLRPFIERLDALTLRERVMVFGAGVALLFVFWHTVLMDPVTARAKVAEQRLAEARRQMSMIDEVGVARVKTRPSPRLCATARWSSAWLRSTPSSSPPRKATSNLSA